MRALAICVVLLAATSVARAEDDAWSGVWTVDGSTETREIKKEGALLALAGKFVAGDDRTITLTGAPSGDRLRLFGRLDANLSMVDKLGGGKKTGRKHTVSIDADLDASKSSVDAKVTVDGSTHDETWVRGKLVIVALEVDGKPLTGPFDAKLAMDGMVVKYRVNGAPLHLTARIKPGTGHPFASFYSAPLLSRDLGVVAPGEHVLPWDGRDETSARRIALEGSYTVTLEAGTVKETKSFDMAAARFEAMGSDWTALDDEQRRPRFNPKMDLDEICYLLTPLDRGGFASGGASMVTKPADVDRIASRAASFMIATHGEIEGLTTCDGLTSETYEPAALFGRDLKDVHFAFIRACKSGSGPQGETTLDELVGAGCDVVIGFDASIDIKESRDYAKVVILFLSRGCPIEKTARDIGRAFPSDAYSRDGGVAPLDGDGVVQVRRAPGIPEDESLWPPRYGCSTN